jgi:hypothetical protein
MKAFQCACGQPLFFDNVSCLKCGSEVGFDPVDQALGALAPDGEARWRFQTAPAHSPVRFALCANRAAASACNWLIREGDDDTQCLSCRLTRTIPNLSLPRNPERLRNIESAKRRVLFALLNLRLPILPRKSDPERGLEFDFLEALPGEPRVVTGHASGVITIDVAEADAEHREKHRESLTEPYRTLIGHFRHELAHYYWDLLIRDTTWIAPFRELFGDERAEYPAALERHYREGPPADWNTRWISAYAAAHPWEDWAESWAHYLHLEATLETIEHFGLALAKPPFRADPFSMDALWRQEPEKDARNFLTRINTWITLTAVLNEVSRSMGQPDLYPFILNAPSVKKLHFVHCVIHHPPPARDASALRKTG